MARSSKYSPETRALALDMVSQGKRLCEVAKDLGIRPNTLWKWANPERHREYNRVHARKRRYGTSRDDVNRMLERQRGLCAMCDDPFEYCSSSQSNKAWCVDHRHDATRAVRGLLCNHCNRFLLPSIESSASRPVWCSEEFWERATAYLQRSVEQEKTP